MAASVSGFLHVYRGKYDMWALVEDTTDPRVLRESPRVLLECPRRHDLSPGCPVTILCHGIMAAGVVLQVKMRVSRSYLETGPTEIVVAMPLPVMMYLRGCGNDPVMMAW